MAAAVPFAAELLPADGTPRERLARWVTDPGNKAFGQAIANRVWAQLFGRPLVEPIDDIPLARSALESNSDGQSDDRASDKATAALAILADDFAAHGYDLSRLISIIALSDAICRL